MNEVRANTNARWEIVPKFGSSRKNEYICTFILDQGNVYLDFRDS